MKELTATRRETLRLQRELLRILQQLSPAINDNVLPPQDNWLSTGQLAMTLDIGIYRTRYLLLDMMKKKQVLVSERAINNALRWFPDEKTPHTSAPPEI